MGHDKISRIKCSNKNKMRTQSGIAKQMQQAINWSRRRSITNLLFCSFLNDYLYHFHQCQKLKKKEKIEVYRV
jgi:hypothetical protein